MNQKSKLQKLANLSYFDVHTLSQIMPLSPNSLHVNIKRWLNSGDLVGLKKGLYVTREYYLGVHDKNAYMEFIACKLREPCYLSLEYVLQKSSILTQAVYAVTAVTLKSKRVYTNKQGTFIYRHIADNLFIGFKKQESDTFEIWQATKAKALFDYLYLYFFRKNAVTVEDFASLRLNLDEFNNDDMKEFTGYCKITGAKKFLVLPKLIKENRDFKKSRNHRARRKSQK